MTGPPIRENQSTAAPELDKDMTPSDIVFELTQLRFDHSEFRRIKLDRDVRDWLITRLATRRT